mmetsp:Transcript_16812/g.65680  ORF Transcript_16812/g.65680 Transcript_16812/m.65680 type:complete len:245 (+) Transcript_16812:662-1396(+)
MRGAEHGGPTAARLRLVDGRRPSAGPRHAAPLAPLRALRAGSQAESAERRLFQLAHELLANCALYPPAARAPRIPLPGGAQVRLSGGEGGAGHGCGGARQARGGSHVGRADATVEGGPHGPAAGARVGDFQAALAERRRRGEGEASAQVPQAREADQVPAGGDLAARQVDCRVPRAAVSTQPARATARARSSYHAHAAHRRARPPQGREPARPAARPWWRAVPKAAGADAELEHGGAGADCSRG